MDNNLIKKVQETDLFQPPSPREQLERERVVAKQREAFTTQLLNDLKSPLGVGFFREMALQLNSELTDIVIQRGSEESFGGSVGSVVIKIEIMPDENFISPFKAERSVRPEDMHAMGGEPNEQ